MCFSLKSLLFDKIGRKRRKQRLPRDILRQSIRRRGRSVETCWSPLTPEHGFPSLFFGPDPGRSPSIRSRRTRGAARFSLPPLQKETRRAPEMPPCRLRSDSLRWHYPHQVKGRRFIFLSAVKLPCICLYYCTEKKLCQY